MSEESARWLNTMTLIGFKEKRGTAWHYRAAYQGDEPNHYDGPIPVEDVLRRLFNFTVDPEPIFRLNKETGTFDTIEGRKAMVTSDTGETLGLFKAGYQGHQYQEWLIDHVNQILGEGLGIASAGLLKNRAQAWVQVEAPENVQTKEGVIFRPFVLATTSFDGSLATTYKNGVTLTVCDNTLRASLSEEGSVYKVKHSKYGTFSLHDASQALGLIEQSADAFSAQVTDLCDWTVTDAQFDEFMSKLVPIPEAKENVSTRGRTMAITKNDVMRDLYENDDRVAPWNGTAFGVLQAVNTYNQHEAAIRGDAGRAMRNMENVVSGKLGTADLDAITKLREVCYA